LRDTIEGGATRTRRALLAGAAGAAAAAAATAIAPAAALAHDVDDVQKGVDNATATVTSITQGTADTNAFEANGNASGVGVVGTTDAIDTAGVVGLAGDPSGSVYVSRDFPIEAGVYGFCAADDASSGLMGEGPNGVFGFGDWGVYSSGYNVGVYANAYNNGTAIHGHVGSSDAPALASNIALRGTVTNQTQAGIQAYGKVQFPNRSGRVAVPTGKSSVAKAITGVTSTNYAFAVLNANKAGVYVRAVVPAAGKITIYLNKAAPSGTSVAYVVLG
jgi:hypothetical protein